MPAYTLRIDKPFSLNLTLSCGQVFRWEMLADGSWRGIVGNQVISIRQERDRLIFAGTGRRFIEHYFALDMDLNAITKSFDRDPFIHTAIARCRGLRIIRQPPWECLISYICATNSNIPIIRRRIENIARAFGTPIVTEWGIFYSFPEPAALAGCCASVLSECKAGYRGSYIQKTSCDIDNQKAWAEGIRSLSYDSARMELMRYSGVGPKAADCILLFGFQKYEAFPVDVWIRRIIHKNYLREPGHNRSLTPKKYHAIRFFAWKHFGEYCGYAQEYLYAAREEEIPLRHSGSGNDGDFGRSPRLRTI